MPRANSKDFRRCRRSPPKRALSSQKHNLARCDIHAVEIIRHELHSLIEEFSEAICYWPQRELGLKAEPNTFLRAAEMGDHHHACLSLHQRRQSRKRR